MNKYIIISSVLLLSSCDGGSDNIKKVKDISTNYDSTITIGNAFEHRDICSSVKWSSDNDDRGRDIVSYTCDLDSKYINDYFNNRFSDVEDAINKKIDKDVSSNIGQVMYSRSNVDELSKIKSAIESFNADGLYTAYQESVKRLEEEVHYKKGVYISVRNNSICDTRSPGVMVENYAKVDADKPIDQSIYNDVSAVNRMKMELSERCKDNDFLKETSYGNHTYSGHYLYKGSPTKYTDIVEDVYLLKPVKQTYALIDNYISKKQKKRNKSYNGIGWMIDSEC